MSAELKDVRRLHSNEVRVGVKTSSQCASVLNERGLVRGKVEEGGNQGKCETVHPAAPGRAVISAMTFAVSQGAGASVTSPLPTSPLWCPAPDSHSVTANCRHLPAKDMDMSQGHAFIK